MEAPGSQEGKSSQGRGIGEERVAYRGISRDLQRAVLTSSAEYRSAHGYKETTGIMGRSHLTVTKKRQPLIHQTMIKKKIHQITETSQKEIHRRDMRAVCGGGGQQYHCRDNFKQPDVHVTRKGFKTL